MIQFASYEELLAAARFETIDYTDNWIYKVLRDHPSLSAAGDDGGDVRYPWTPQSIDEIRLCMFWIVRNGTHTQSIRKKVTSYALKHFVEHDLSGKNFRPYIGNGCFIGAAIVLGYSTSYPNFGPNAYFNMALPKNVTNPYQYGRALS